MIGTMVDKGGAMRLFPMSLAVGLFAGGIAASTADSLMVDGKTVRFVVSERGAPLADFEFNDNGYTNGYTLDCEKRQFLWTKNVRLATGEVTSNSAGAEWKPMNPNSAVSNAVYNAICQELLFDNNDTKTEVSYFSL